MATYSEYLKLRREQEAGESKEPTPGVLRSYFRGLIQSPFDTMNMGGVGQRPAFPQEVTTLEGSRNAQTVSDLLREGVLSRADIDEPVTFSERAAERAGRSTPVAVATLPASFAAGGIPAAAVDIFADVSSTMFEQGAEDVGLGPFGQTMAGIGGAIIVPGFGADNAARRAASARRAVREAADDDTVAAIAKRYGVDPEKVRQASGEAKRRIARDPRGGERFVDDAIDTLDRNNALFPDETARPTTRQALDRRSGQNIAQMEESLARDDLDFSASIEGRKAAVFEDLEQQYDNLVPNGSLGRAKESFDSVLARTKAEEAAAWDAVPFAEMPEVRTSRLKRAVAEVRKEAGQAGRRYVPDEAVTIEGYGESITAKELQALRSELLDTARDAGRFTATRQERRQGARVARLLDAVNKEIDDLPESGTAAYKRARELTAARADVFNPKSRAVQAFSQIDDGAKIARRIMSANDPAGEARRAVRILEQEPGGLDSLRRVFVDDLFGEELGAVKPRSILNKIRRNRPVYEQVLGDDLDRFVEFVDKYRISQIGTAGTAAATKVTGSNINPFVKALFSVARFAASPVESSRIIAQKIAERTPSDVEVMAILREAMLDPDLFKKLLEIPEPRAIPGWVENFDKLVARSRARQALSAAGNVTRGQDDGGVR